MAPTNLSGDAMLSSFLQRMQSRQVEQQSDNNREEQVDEHARQALIKKAQLQKQVVTQQQQSRLSQQEAAGAEKNLARWQALEQGKNGPELLQLAQAPELQQKLNDKLKGMILQAAEQDPAATAHAAQQMTELLGAPGFAEAVPTTQAMGEFGAQMLRGRGENSELRDAIANPFTAAPDGDAPTKQRLLKYASRRVGMSLTRDQLQQKGVSVRRGATMLNTLREAKLPKFAQRAGMAMIERNPDNLEGVDALEDFVQRPPVRNMPQQARGQATQVLAKGDGQPALKQSLLDVAETGAFRSLGREDKSRLFATIGQAKGTALRAVSDQTLRALRSGRFVQQPQQVGRFLTGLGQQIQRGEGGAKHVDGRVLLRKARQSGAPKAPLLLTTEGLDDEEAEMARRSNRSALIAYYNKLGNYQSEADGRLSQAKYFEQVNTITGIKEPIEPELDALRVRAEVREALQQQMAEARAPAGQSRQLPRIEQIERLKALQAKWLADPNLSTDEKTYGLAKTAQQSASLNNQELATRKSRKMRELGRSFMPPAKRRALLGERRAQGVQPRYFRAAQGFASAVARAPLATSRPGAAAGNAERAARAAPSAAHTARAPRSRADVRRLVAQLDPALSVEERMQQATEIIGARMQEEMRSVARQVAEEILGRSPKALANEPKTSAAPKPSLAAVAPIVSGQTDAYGIVRTSERDLGARRDFAPVRAKAAEPAAEPAEEEATSTVRTREIVRHPTTLRPLQELYGLSFVAMSKAESAVFRTLGWTAQMWEGKNNPNAPVPNAYATPYAKLSRPQKQAVRLLGLSAEDWDVQAAQYAPPRP